MARSEISGFALQVAKKKFQALNRATRDLTRAIDQARGVGAF